MCGFRCHVSSGNHVLEFAMSSTVAVFDVWILCICARLDHDYNIFNTEGLQTTTQRYLLAYSFHSLKLIFLGLRQVGSPTILASKSLSQENFVIKPKLYVCKTYDSATFREVHLASETEIECSSLPPTIILCG